MKKVMLLMLGVLLFAPAAFADNWGLGLKLGAGENDPATLSDDFHANGGELDKNAGYFGLEALYEYNLDELNKLGAKVAWDSYGENELKRDWLKVTEKTFAFPFTVYFKQDYGVKKWSWFAGAGMTILRSKLEAGSREESKTRAFPHIMAGAEYRFTELFALGLEARYNFSAKVKKNDLVLSDRSGFGAALTGRFYF